MQQLDDIKNKIASLNLTPVIGAELEFYFLKEIKDSLIEKLSKNLIANNINIAEVKKETGASQYEIVFAHSNNIEKVIQNIITGKILVENFAKQHQNKAIFKSKPFSTKPGCSLHFHISLLDENSKNIFIQPTENFLNEENKFMLHAIGGLLELLPASMKYFCPNKDAYLRLKDFESPSTISWGGNNRTTAIRIPTTTTSPKNRRIEHRVSGAEADPSQVIYCILLGIWYGISSSVVPKTNKIYGVASDPQYNLENIPNSWDEAADIKHRLLS